MSRLGKEMINCSHLDDRQRAVGIQLPAASLKPPDVEWPTGLHTVTHPWAPAIPLRSERNEFWGHG